MNRLNDLLALSHVPRWSIISHARPQSVADHTFRVMVIATELSSRLNVPLHMQDLLYALEHDAHESWTADIPAPMKAKIENFGFLLGGIRDWMKKGPHPTGYDQHNLIKLADKIEAYTFITKNGEGMQAHRVSEAMEAMLDDTLRCYPQWRFHVEEVMTEIIEETGRGTVAWQTESS